MAYLASRCSTLLLEQKADANETGTMMRFRLAAGSHGLPETMEPPTGIFVQPSPHSRCTDEGSSGGIRTHSGGVQYRDILADVSRLSRKDAGRFTLTPQGGLPATGRIFLCPQLHNAVVPTADLLCAEQAICFLRVSKCNEAWTNARHGTPDQYLPACGNPPSRVDKAYRNLDCGEFDEADEAGS